MEMKRPFTRNMTASLARDRSIYLAIAVFSVASAVVTDDADGMYLAILARYSMRAINASIVLSCVILVFLSFISIIRGHKSPITFIYQSVFNKDNFMQFMQVLLYII